MNNLQQQQKNNNFVWSEETVCRRFQNFHCKFMITKKEKENPVQHQARCINLATVLRLCHKFDQLAKYGSFL